MTRRKPHTDAFKKRHPQQEHTVGYDRQRARHVMKQYIAQARRNKRGGDVGTSVLGNAGQDGSGADGETEEGTVESA